MVDLALGLLELADRGDVTVNANDATVENADKLEFII